MEIIIKALRVSLADFFLVDLDAFENEREEMLNILWSGFTRYKWPEYVD